MNEIVTAISTLGFPIVVCLITMWFVKYLIDNTNKQIADLTKVVLDNTNVTKELLEYLRRGDTHD